MHRKKGEGRRKKNEVKRVNQQHYNQIEKNKTFQFGSEYEITMLLWKGGIIRVLT